MKTFIQEKISSLLIATGSFNVVTMLNQEDSMPISKPLFCDDDEARTRQLLKTCDALKKQYRATQDDNYLRQYYETRNQIKIGLIRE